MIVWPLVLCSASFASLATGRVMPLGFLQYFRRTDRHEEDEQHQQDVDHRRNLKLRIFLRGHPRFRAGLFRVTATSHDGKELRLPVESRAAVRAGIDAGGHGPIAHWAGGGEGH